MLVSQLLFLGAVENFFLGFQSPESKLEDPSHRSSLVLSLCFPGSSCFLFYYSRLLEIYFVSVVKKYCVKAEDVATSLIASLSSSTRTLTLLIVCPI